MVVKHVEPPQLIYSMDDVSAGSVSGDSWEQRATDWGDCCRVTWLIGRSDETVRCCNCYCTSSMASLLARDNAGSAPWHLSINHKAQRSSLVYMCMQHKSLPRSTGPWQLVFCAYIRSCTVALGRTGFTQMVYLDSSQYCQWIYKWVEIWLQEFIAITLIFDD